MQQNARGVKGPYFGCVGRRCKREGMSGHEIRSNHPVGFNPAGKARQVRGRLWLQAKVRSGGGCTHESDAS